MKKSKRWLLGGVAVVLIIGIAIWAGWPRSPDVRLTFLKIESSGSDRQALFSLENLSDDESVTFLGYSAEEPLLTWRRPSETGWTSTERDRVEPPMYYFPLRPAGEKLSFSMPLRNRNGSPITDAFLVKVAVFRQASPVVLQLNKALLPLFGRQFRDYVIMDVTAQVIVP